MQEACELPVDDEAMMMLHHLVHSIDRFLPPMTRPGKGSVKEAAKRGTAG